MSCWPASRGPHGQVFVGWKSTLIRLELVGRTGRYHKIGNSAESLDRLLVDLFLESHTTRPEQIVLDLDATDIPLYGHQPERFFHGYYDSYCYLPLYIFSGDQLLCARLCLITPMCPTNHRKTR